MVVFEIGFGEVTMQMSLADMVELPVNGPLEQSEEPLDRVGVVKAASAHIFVGAND